MAFVFYLTGGADENNLEPAVTIYSPGWNHIFGFKDRSMSNHVRFGPASIEPGMVD